MINVDKLKDDMKVLGSTIRTLKDQFKKAGTSDNAQALLAMKKTATKMYVLRAGLHNKHHIRDRSCAWHNKIMEELTLLYDDGKSLV